MHQPDPMGCLRAESSKIRPKPSTPFSRWLPNSRIHVQRAYYSPLLAAALAQ
ncbi:hypothetical protein [Leptothermofonsia sp. ETS-13]|uniref:hypothetical protein n=1 Tax=Leptothermofonsia sp. ETS-13 TaxID=3035696 RepID=UPI003BA15C7E